MNYRLLWLSFRDMLCLAGIVIGFFLFIFGFMFVGMEYPTVLVGLIISVFVGIIWHDLYQVRKITSKFK